MSAEARMKGQHTSLVLVSQIGNYVYMVFCRVMILFQISNPGCSSCVRSYQIQMLTCWCLPILLRSWTCQVSWYETCLFFLCNACKLMASCGGMSVCKITLQHICMEWAHASDGGGHILISSFVYFVGCNSRSQETRSFYGHHLHTS